jgi:hypothetical protein
MLVNLKRKQFKYWAFIEILDSCSPDSNFQQGVYLKNPKLRTSNDVV